MKKTSGLEKVCREKGVKMTAQRRTVLDVLSEADDHPSVEAIWKRAQKRDRKIGVATVYRTLKRLEAEGVAERLDLADGRARYEKRAAQHHHHLIDVKTHEVIEFTDEELEAVQRRLAAERGYRIVAERFELYVERIDKRPPARARKNRGR